jgi:hypothetical protein
VTGRGLGGQGIRSPSDRGRGCRGLGDRGAVAAEFAVSLPAVVVVIALGVGALAVGASQVRLQDAVSDAARLAARGESDARVTAVLAAADATGAIERRGDDLVCVTASLPASLFDLRATGCALDGGL